MNVTINEALGRVAVTILQPHGDLDAASYQHLIATAQEARRSGASNILLDLGDKRIDHVLEPVVTGLMGLDEDIAGVTDQRDKKFLDDKALFADGRHRAVAEFLALDM